MASPDTFNVAIVGGGLCGLSLAIALRKRSIPFKIYETRGSFTELGAGINIGPNTLQAFQLIDPSLGKALEQLWCRNPPGKENVWMQIRLGAPTDNHEDATLVTELMAPPTGNVTVGRNDLLQALAERAGFENAVFNKKLVGYSQTDENVELNFADGTEATASAVVACDGIHSAVRRVMLGPDQPTTRPVYSGVGVYRGILATEDLEPILGSEGAHTSQIFVGPEGYVILYPIEHGKKVNTGFWSWKREQLPNPDDWVLPAQRKAMEAQFAQWGTVVHKIMHLMGNPPFFATHHHAAQPESHYQGRVCLIGDAAHSMSPHQGAGAGQAMEDAFVMAEVLSFVDKLRPAEKQLEAAFKAYEAVRKPRSQRVLETSHEAFSIWTALYEKSLTGGKLQRFVEEAKQRFQWIWHGDIEGQAERATAAMKEALEESTLEAHPVATARMEHN
ncbi:hypothetical protein LTR36_009248 [Oleoguttula mirabilis]|uniref:FAD-binding domain-containing protein n=1 Tax=Oleoguttula mirabilis TaxID=1507867 RepID=A0AAV9J603_9PEZI|nr:hypothetical protein LTR36_009248 [Oleoguttula mirabilis]